MSQEHKNLATSLTSELEKIISKTAEQFYLDYKIKGVTFTPPSRRRRGGSDGTNTIVAVEFTSMNLFHNDINVDVVNAGLSYNINKAISGGSISIIDSDQEALSQEAQPLTELKGKDTPLNNYLTQCVPNQESFYSMNAQTHLFFK